VETSEDSTEEESDPWKLPTVGSCYGAACCSTGQIYDSAARVCKIDESYKSDVENFETQINKNPGIYSKKYYKPDVNL
jgi:hypothetical protein